MNKKIAICLGWELISTGIHGHMVKTKRQIVEDLKLIDVVIELLDSRIPISSRNPDIYELTKNKKRIIILNKCDLADEKISQKWLLQLGQEAPTLLIDSNSGKGIEKVGKIIEEIMKEEIEKKKQKGINKTIRVMILGIPNVGKSSFINRISKKTSMEVGNRPGVTKRKQWIRIGNNQELLDTPGVLWPKFESNNVALKLAYTGSIKDDILDSVEIAYSLLKEMYLGYKENILNRYKISSEEITQIENDDNFTYSLMQLIGKKIGALSRGGVIDDEKVSKVILDDFRNCRYGKISLEVPNE